MAVTYRYTYSKSDSFLFQGNTRDLQEYLKEGYVIISGGNGSWNISRPAYGKILKITTGTRIEKEVILNPKEFIRQRYGKIKVSEADYRRLVADLEAGKLNFEEIS